MATLADTLRQQREGQLQIGPGGELQKTTPIQQLAGQAGLPSTPTTPVVQGMLGATPDQTKMAGTPQQKQAAVQQATQPGQSLQDTLRRQQSRTQMTGAEQSEKQKSQDMQNLGSLGDRVSDFINTQRQKLETQAGQGVQVQAAAQTVSGQDLTQISDLLGQLRSDPGNMNLQLQANQALGRDVNTTISPDEINSLYESATQSLARGGAQVTSDQMSVGDLLQNQQFGYNEQQLSNLLGVPTDQLKQYTVKQLQDKINQVTQDEFTKSQQLAQQAKSTELGAAERGVARQAGREASATGLRSTEADMGKLNQSIQKADQVQFGGKTYAVGDLLQDDTISGIITDYINAAPGSDTRKQLESTEPQLVDFINKNQAVLEDAAKQLSTGATQFGTIQQTNQKIATLNGSLTPDVASALVPEYGKLQAQQIDPSKYSTLQYAQNLNPDQQRQYGAAISGLHSQFGEDFTGRLRQMSPSELAAFQLENPNSGPVKQYTQQMNQFNQLKSANDVDTLLSGVLDQKVPAAQLQQDVSTNRALQTLGMGGNSALNVFEDGKGNLLGMNEMKSKLIQGMPTPQTVINGVQKVPGQIQYQPVSPPASGTQAALYNDLAGAARSGKISASDINTAFGSTANMGIVDRYNKIDELDLLKNAPNLDSSSRNMIDKLQSDMRSNDSNNVITNLAGYQSMRAAQVGPEQSLRETLKSFSDTLNDPRASKRFDTNSLRQRMNEYQKQLNDIEAQKSQEGPQAGSPQQYYAGAGARAR